MRFVLFRNDPTSIDKIKNKKWKGFNKKAKGCTSTKSTSPEETKTSLTRQNIRDVKQLINFLVQEQSKYDFIWVLILNFEISFFFFQIYLRKESSEKPVL